MATILPVQHDSSVFCVYDILMYLIQIFRYLKATKEKKKLQFELEASCDVANTFQVKCHCSDSTDFFDKFPLMSA